MNNTWTVKRRIVAGFSALTAIVIAVGVVGFSGLQNTITTAQSISQQIKDHGRFLTDSVNLARSAQVDFKKQVQAWKDILLRGSDAAAFAKYTEEFDRQQAATLADLQKLHQLFDDSKVDTKLVDQSAEELQKLGLRYHEALKSYDAAKLDSCFVVDRMVKGMDRPATDAIDAIVQQAEVFAADVTKATEAQFQQRAHRMQIMIASGTVLGTLFAAICALAMSRSLNRQLLNLANALESNSSQVTSAAHQVSEASQALAEGSSEQAASIEETSASLEELSSMTRRNAENAQKANELAKQTRSSADKGVNDMETMNSAMAAVQASSDDIAKIIKTIDEIAFQTNILALNAAVEAARAGEAGMGFAVVADEVRNLAQRSAQAAKETAAKIESAIGRSAQGVDISGKVGQTLNDIAVKARQVDELAAEVATASSEQTQGIGQINTAVGQMDKVTQSNAASAEESAAAAEELNAQAQVMKQSVSELLQLVGGQRSDRSEAGVSRFQARAAGTSMRKPVKSSVSTKSHSAAVPALTAAGGSRKSAAGNFEDF
jgi:methyl-accepting chemotaxis protein